jgi:anti-sigma B factor antagonist
MPDTWGLNTTSEALLVHGEIDYANADSFEEQATDVVLEAAGTSILIDLSGVTFIDSAGIGALIRVLELETGRALIVQPSRQVFRILQLVALTDGVLPNVEILQPK